MFEAKFLGPVGQARKMDRGAFLGQVSLWAGPANTPFYSAPTGGPVINSQGGQLMTEQINSPSHAYEELHCYQAPDGTFVSIPLGAASVYKAAGYVAVDSANCGGAGLRGPQRR